MESGEDRSRAVQMRSEQFFRSNMRQDQRRVHVSLIEKYDGRCFALYL